MGGWLANALHGPAHLVHVDTVERTASNDSISVHICQHGHSHTAPDSDDSSDEPTNHDHDCPVCDHLTLAAVTPVSVALPALGEVVRVQPIAERFAVPRGLIGLSLSRGPPA